jgi:enterochelin esterase family protein
MMDQQLVENLFTFEPQHFSVQTLVVESAALAGNPLDDPARRRNPVLVPKATPPSDGWPVVFMLSGFTSNGTTAFNVKTFEDNLPQSLDRAMTAGAAPEAVYLFCDAMTSWGGSQFINSAGTGRYEDYVAKELPAALRAMLPVAKLPRRWAVMGGSSGGYGALHLATRYPEVFGYALALAPDGFFEASLLHEILTALPTLKALGGIRGIGVELARGNLLRRKDSHVVLNTIAMGLCYSPDGQGGVEFPVDFETGIVIERAWAKWLKHDPVRFLAERAENVKKVERFYLDVGNRDQFQLQYAARQMRDVLVSKDARVDYSEFDGGHFDLSARRPEAWKWLRRQWNG